MKVIREAGEMAAQRWSTGTVAFVPTMGALHEGHMSLLRIARERAVTVVVSIFVNPLQFGMGEDFEDYPRTEDTDLAQCAKQGVDVVFVPPVAEMYPEGRAATVSPGPLGESFEGAARPGHFEGVCTVVAKLFNIVGPNIAVFGQKDAQQLAVIRKMVSDLSFGIEIMAAPTIREADGLALSSRNAYLSLRERADATALLRALESGRETLLGGRGAEVAEKVTWETLVMSDGVEPEYAAAVDPDTFSAPLPGRPVLLVVAARVGSTRLIDNLLIEDFPNRMEEP